MNDLHLLGFLFGGLALGSVTAFVLFLPFSQDYFGHRTMAVAAALPTLAFFIGASGFWFIVLLSVATGVSFILLLPPLLRSRSTTFLKRPVLPTLAIFAADAWNSYILVLASDSAFMGGSC